MGQEIESFEISLKETESNLPQAKTMTTINQAIYFGTVPGRNQSVGDKLKERGINLLRAEPSGIHVSGSPRWIEPNYSIYKCNLPAFLDAALTNTKVSAGKSAFVGLNYPKNWSLLPIPYPGVVITWDKPIAEEVMASLRTKGFRDILARGKPAMVHDNPTVDVVRDALETRCLQSSPAPENCVNIYSFKRLVLVNKIISAFLRVHQYPAFIDKNHVEEFSKAFTWEKETAADEDDEDESEEDDVEMKELENTSIKGSFRINLKVHPQDRALHYDEHTIIEHLTDGLLFKYEPDLAKFDRSTVLNLLKNYFYGCMGENRVEAAEVWEDVVSGLSIAANTEWMNKFAHICKVIDIAIRMQCVPYIMMGAQQYDGVYLSGTGYHLGLGENYYEALEKEVIAERIKTFDQHAEVLWRILGTLDIMEDAKLNAFRTYTQMKQLKQLIDGSKRNANADTIIRQSAKLLHFPGDRLLEPTGANIAHALSYISDPLKDIYTLPSLHHSALLSDDRLEIIWSAFGDTAPSFLVPGGRRMGLNGPFSVVTKSTPLPGGGSSKSREVTKIGAIIKPLDKAIADLRDVKRDSSVMNPFGNMVVNAAASHMNKMYEKESATLILGALRKFVGASVADVGRGKKRRNEGDEETAPKKRRVDDL